MKKILEPYKIRKSKWQPGNLKLLTKAMSQDILAVIRCNRLICGLCKHLLEGETHFIWNPLVYLVTATRAVTTLGWSGGAIVPGKLPVPGLPTIGLQ